MSVRPIPLTVVGGYLGSGKTTAITDLLLTRGVERIGVIVNDFGELDVDARLLATADEVVGFDNGCVCCVASEGIRPALATLQRQQVDRVVIEASGVADPAMFASWSQSPGFSAGGVVVCADASALAARLRDRWVGDTVARQLVAADAILLTHADVTSSALLDGAAFLARERSRGAQVLVRTSDIGLRDAIAVADRPRGGEAGPGTHLKHVTWTLEASGPVDIAALVAALSRLPTGVVRVKGFVRDTDGVAVLIQSTPGRATASSATGVDVPARSALTVIAIPGTPPDVPALLALGLVPVVHESEATDSKEAVHAHSN